MWVALPLLEGSKAFAVAAAGHVVRIRNGAHDPLPNDSDLLVTEFVKRIEIEGDGVLEANTIMSRPTVIFTLDLPFPFSAADKQFWGHRRRDHAL
jgi:hypothetical protein